VVLRKMPSKRRQFGSNSYFENAGVKAFSDYDIIVVKMGYLEPDLSQAQKGWVMALPPGAVDQNLTELPYKKRRRPLYPFEGADFDPQLSVQTKTYIFDGKAREKQGPNHRQ
jgi:microcystin degradation protein MlrC